LNSDSHFRWELCFGDAPGAAASRTFVDLGGEYLGEEGEV
jgi:hypothetical protein